MLRGPLLALSLIVLAAAGAQAARADDGGAAPTPTVTLAPSDGASARPLALADLVARYDVHGASYTVRAADGTERAIAVADGISLTALLAAAGLDADAFDYIALAKADGSSAIVMRDDLGGTDEGPPVVWSDGGGVHFLRPSSGEGDANDADLVTLADGAPLALALKTGEPLVPRIAVSKLRVRPRERVDLSASLVGGAPLGPGLDYSWYFDGTGRVRGANVSHRFRRPGTYLVLLNVVRGDGTSIGAPDTVHIRVVRARERRADDARGADESHGDGDGTGGAAGAGSGAGSGTGSGAAPPATSATPPAAVSPAVAPATPPVRDRAPARRTPPGELVSGTLLASAGAAAAPLDSGRAASAAARGAAADGPPHVPVGVWIAAGALALLALGWALESRHTIPFWQP
ncbi:MAG TPA: PKD domain-containing protein [Conexibacter sp.]